MRDPLALVLAFGAAVAVAAWLAPHFSYNRWDNFEYFTPTILEAHTRWLHGHLPLWTSRQNLGEPLLANAQPGALYPVYTVAVAIVALLHRPGWLMMVTAALHFLIGLPGWFVLGRRLGMRPWLSAVTAFTVEGGGFAAVIVPLWTFMGGILCWIPWALYGTLRALHEPDDPRALWVPAALALLAAIGHPQMLVYAWLWLLVTGGVFGWAERAPARAWRRWAGLLTAAALLSAPTLVPVFLETRISPRAVVFPYAEYVARSVSPGELLSLILPVVRSTHGYLGTVGSLSFYQGSWVALGLGAGLIAVGVRVVRSKTRWPRRISDEALPHLRFLCAVAAAVPFVLLSLGRWGGLEKLLYGLPIWSSFRWPFKFLLFAGPGISLAAGLGVEAWLGGLSRPHPRSRSYLALVLWAASLLWIADAAGWIGRHPMYSFAFTALFALSLIGLMTVRRWGAVLLVGCGWGGVVLVQAFAQVSDLQGYDEPLAAYGPSFLGIDASDRVLPVSSGLPLDDMQPMAFFQSGMLNGYDVATGTTTAMTPSWFLDLLPSNTVGLMPDSTYRDLLGSHLLKALDVRYAVVRNTDREATDWLREGGFHPVRQLERSSVWEQGGVLPRVYFADEERPYSKRGVREGLVQNRAPVRTAFLEDISASTTLPEARVLSVEGRSNGIRVRVDAPAGGLFVFSSTYYPQWSALADGMRIPVLRVNGLVTGARIPPGTRTVEFRFGFAGFVPSLLLFGAGLVILGLWVRTRREGAVVEVRGSA